MHQLTVASTFFFEKKRTPEFNSLSGDDQDDDMNSLAKSHLQVLYEQMYITLQTTLKITSTRHCSVLSAVSTTVGCLRYLSCHCLSSVFDI